MSNIDTYKRGMRINEAIKENIFNLEKFENTKIGTEETSQIMQILMNNHEDYNLINETLNYS